MARRGFRPARKPKVQEKRVSYQLIKPDTKDGEPIYQLMNRTIEQHHEELTNARIVIAWNLAWKPDKDGRVILGKCKKASDLDRELSPYDFVILLRKEFWQHPQTTDAQRAALLDHELCHASVQLDAALEPKRDERGRVVYRMRKHDIEEFSEILHRHGCYKSDLENAFLAMQTHQMTLDESSKTKRIDKAEKVAGATAH
jgi:hypothetical protein